MELTIRKMRADDFDHGFVATLNALSPVELTNEQAQSIFRRRKPLGIRTYVAMLDGDVVGTASLLLEPKFIHGGGTVGHIEDVAVHVRQQHHGIGAKLVEHLLEVCRQAGCYKVILDCAEHNIPFYGKLGFKEWEHAMRKDLP